MATYAIGDIHGQLKALVQCLERCSFDFANDHLICLGDVADRGFNTYECFELLLTIKNLTYILGNHDKWFLDWLDDPETLNQHWLNQGGKQTLQSYKNNMNEQLYKHHKLLETAPLFFMDEQNRLFVHGGFEMQTPLENAFYDQPEIFYWDRTVWKKAIENTEPISFQLSVDNPVYENDIFIGHSNTFLSFPDLKPVNFQNVWNLDQGAAYGGKLTIMNVDTYDYWQSDLIAGIAE